MTAVLGAFASAAFAGLIVVAGYAASPSLLAGAVALSVLVLAVGWGALLDLPSRRGTALVILLVGCGGAALAVKAANMTRPLAPYAALLAGAVLLAFVHELARRGGRKDLVESVTGTLPGEALALLGGGWALLPGTKAGLPALAVAAAAVAATRLGALAPVPPQVAGWVSLAVGAGAGTATALVLDPRHPLPVIAVAATVACVVAGLDRLLVTLSDRRAVHAVLATAAAPVLAVGTVGYAVARLIG